MKKLVALAMVLSLGLFFALGCPKEKAATKPAGEGTKPAVTSTEKDTMPAPAAEPAKPADDKKEGEKATK